MKTNATLEIKNNKNKNKNMVYILIKLNIISNIIVRI